MPISFVNFGTYTEKASGAPISVPYPSGLQVNDVLVLLLGGNSATVIGTQTGYTTAKSNSSTTDTLVPDAYIGLKYATGSESGTFSATGGAGAGWGQILAFRGVDLSGTGVGSAQDLTATFLDKTATNTPNHVILSVTTNETGCALIYCYTQNASVGTHTAPTTPAQFTKTGDWIAQRNAGTGYLIWSGVGATGTMTVVGNGNTRGIALLCVLKPAQPIRRQGSRRF